MAEELQVGEGANIPLPRPECGSIAGSVLPDSLGREVGWEKELETRRLCLFWIHQRLVDGEDDCAHVFVDLKTDLGGQVEERWFCGILFPGHRCWVILDSGEYVRQSQRSFSIASRFWGTHDFVDGFTSLQEQIWQQGPVFIRYEPRLWIWVGRKS